MVLNALMSVGVSAPSLKCCRNCAQLGTRLTSLPAFSGTFLRVDNRLLPQEPRLVLCRGSGIRESHLLAAAAAAVVVFSSVPASLPAPPPMSDETLANVPQTLSLDEGRAARIQKPKSKKAESCVGKCVTTCIRGGAGSPGEGPLNYRRPLVVFKPGFRSRQYCLIECSDICNLIKDGEDGP